MPLLGGGKIRVLSLKGFLAAVRSRFFGRKPLRFQIQSGGISWTVQRSHKEFCTLLEKIHNLLPDLPLKVSGENKVVASEFAPRYCLPTSRQDLDNLVQCLLNHPQLSQCPEVREFLGLDNHRHGHQHHQHQHQHQHQQQHQQQHQLHQPSQPQSSKTLDHRGKMNGANEAAQSINLGPTEKPSVRPSDFEFLKVIGKGSFGKVLLARHKAEKCVFAVKVLQKAAIMKRNEAQHIMSERNVLLKNVKHPFLVGLHYSFQTADKLYFVLDYVNGGELFFHLQRERFFPEYRAKFYAAEIASALGYLHSEDIIYRDLKPENLLLDSKGHVVLTDFGLCKEGITDEKTTCTFCGTPEYLAPEVLRKQPYDKTVDWWCLGAVLYEMVNGLPPFYSRDTSEMYNNILHKPLVHRANISMAGRSILEHLLHKDKRKRLGAVGDLEEVQQTGFFAEINWQDLYDRKVPPPYNPNVSGQLDLRHFDQEFVREPVPGSVGRSGGSSGGRFVTASVMEANAAFDGFSYVPPADEGFGL